MFWVDVDTGGTMTDTLICGGDKPLLVKVESTPHDVTESFIKSLEMASEMLEFEDLSSFLERVSFIRWTSTLTSNVLAERRGPKLGLIVSDGHEADLYASSKTDIASVVPSLVRTEHIAGLSHQSDRTQVVTVVKRLIDQGIRRINISLKGSFENSDLESDILRIVGEQFPDHFLGSVPALAGSEMLMSPNDMTRTFYALINAYVHNALANSLFKAEDYLKIDMGWRGDLLVGHLNGGVARIGKTKAVDTIESGPLFGTHASAFIARDNSIKKVLAVDIGGTTGKASAINDGRVELRAEGSIFGIPIRSPMPVLRSNALGGGSIASVEGGKLSLGPKSMGAAPGPACYGLGGSSATLTDALVVLGLLLPNNFLGGRKSLDVALATSAIEKHVSEPLKVDARAGAQAVLDCAAKMMSTLVEETAREVGWQQLSGVELFAYGGNGPLFGTLIADLLGIKKVRLFALGTVFSAFGSAISDVLHVYEQAISSDRLDDLIEIGESLAVQAHNDLRGEGFDPEKAILSWTALDKKGTHTQVDGDIKQALPEVLENIEKIAVLRLEARYSVGRVSLPTYQSAEQEEWDDHSSMNKISVIQHGNIYGKKIDGPCLVDGGNFTWFVSHNWSLVVDNKGDAIAERSPSE